MLEGEKKKDYFTAIFVMKSSTSKSTHLSATTLLVNFTGRPFCSMLNIISRYGNYKHLSLEYYKQNSVPITAEYTQHRVK